MVKRQPTGARRLNLSSKSVYYYGRLPLRGCDAKDLTQRQAHCFFMCEISLRGTSMNTLTVSLLFLLLYQSGVSENSLAGKVEVKLHVNKTQFVSGEFIFIDCSIRNRVNRNLHIPELDDRYTERFLTIVDSENRRVRSGIIVHTIGGPPLEVLPSKGQLVKTFSLASYGNTDSFTGIVKNLKPGSYRV